MPKSQDINNLPGHIENRTRPLSRVPAGELVRAWLAIDEQFRHAFVCEALSDQAATALIEALETRHRQRRRRAAA